LLRVDRECRPSPLDSEEKNNGSESHRIMAMRARVFSVLMALAFAANAAAADFGTPGGPAPANVQEIVDILKQDPYDLELLISYGTSKGGSAGPEPGSRFPNTAAGNLRVPDLSYYLPGNIDEDDDEDYPARPPDLCVEVRSKGQSAAGQQDRLAFLREQSVGCTLLIDPEARTVEVYDRGRAWVASAKDEVVLSGLGGFTFRVGELFA